MSVLLETSVGDLVIDLLVDDAPKACENFLKLCKLKYYNYAPLYNIQKGFSFQTGDPLGPSSKESDGGSCVWGLLDPSASRTFTPEKPKHLKHDERGTVSFACAPSTGDPDVLVAGSQFIVTLADSGIEYLDSRAAVFGRLAEGFDVLERVNDAFVDDSGMPLRDIRILHTAILEDPYPDPPGLLEPDKSPLPTPAQLSTVRIAYDEDMTEELDEAALAKLKADREAKAQALTLEMVGDLPFADVAPPENILFVCKLNPVTQDSDLELLFSRFGTILSCEIIRDKRTGDSLQYAFIEFENRSDCERAYEKMQDVLIDDHRIHVDFSQSVSKLSDVWRDSQNTRRAFKRGGGGFGGVRELEKRSQYRAHREEVEEGGRRQGRGAGGGGYGMVEEEQDKGALEKERDRYLERTEKKERRRSRSPRDRDRDGGSRRDRNGRDDERRKNDRRDRDRDRDRDRYRDDRRRRDRSRDRHRDYDRRR